MTHEINHHHDKVFESIFFKIGNIASVIATNVSDHHVPKDLAIAVRQEKEIKDRNIRKNEAKFLFNSPLM